MTTFLKDSYYIEKTFILLLSLYFFSLPISGVTAVQNILFFVFSIYFLLYYRKDINFKIIYEVKEVLFILFILFILACFSYFNSIDPHETVSEIRSEFLKPFVYFLLLLFFATLVDKSTVYKIIIYMGIVLVMHSLINIVIWIDNGGWPVRTGGLLDGTIVAINKHMAGERFGIWATYTLSFSIALMVTKYRKIAIGLILLSILSIVANNTRATFIGVILIFFSYFIFFYKNRLIKITSLVLITLCMLLFVYFSKNLEPRYNVYKMLNSLKYITVYSPSEFKKFEVEHGLGHSSISRLAMWKSVINYRIEEPWIPQSYGRFLYAKSLKDLYENHKENIPYVVYPQAHSDFMSILFSLGFFGLICFIIFLILVLKINYIIFRKSKFFKFYGIFAFLGTIGYIASMTFGSFFGDSEQLYFYILLGISSSIYLNILRYNREAKY